MKASNRNRNPFFWLALALLAIVFVGPVAMMILTSFKTRIESQSLPPTILPQEWTMRAYEVLFAADSTTPVLRWSSIRWWLPRATRSSW
ncbi:hypothetical protein [Tessaracoccus sp. MC1679]|uniref:hypothetical protein n=1 Tax=Tessaracoccus sp. MC1679 TaxID=2760313 RepID=UPI002102D51F|nr:hypothetical protein [Tessaracoccus sp. MC1679]